MMYLFVLPMNDKVEKMYITGMVLMVVLGAYAPGSCGFATRCLIIEAKFLNGHINYQLEDFENISFF